jgi:hypothetical protein
MKDKQLIQKFVADFHDNLTKQRAAEALKIRIEKLHAMVIDEQDFPYNRTFKAQDLESMLDLSLNNDDVASMKSSIEVQDSKHDTPQKIIDQLKSDLTTRLDMHVDLSFKHYIAEIEQAGVEHWRGCITDLHVIARILKIKISLYIEQPNLEVQLKTFGEDDFIETAHIIKKGNCYFAFDPVWSCPIKPNHGLLNSMHEYTA